MDRDNRHIPQDDPVADEADRRLAQHASWIARAALACVAVAAGVVLGMWWWFS